jgi:stress-induced morphogen
MVVVSPEFEGKNMVKQQRMVYEVRCSLLSICIASLNPLSSHQSWLCFRIQALKDFDIGGAIHSLQLVTKSPSQWNKE